ncbi:MAG: type II toxin-antitoxin system PemK/MazF family toxin [Acidimicrobiales bacterium]
MPSRGEVWWGEIPESGRRPYLILSRNAAIPVLGSIVVAPVTRTVRGIPTEVALGPEDGMPTECAASLDSIRVVPKANLVQRLCSLGPAQMALTCAALRKAVDC